MTIEATVENGSLFKTEDGYEVNTLIVQGRRRAVKLGSMELSIEDRRNLRRNKGGTITVKHTNPDHRFIRVDGKLSGFVAEKDRTRFLLQINQSASLVVPEEGTVIFKHTE